VIPGESERHFQAEVIRLCKALHRRFYFTLHSKGSPEGWPDLVILQPPVLRIRELKTNTGALTQPQRETIDLLKECNYVDVGVWRPRDWTRIVEELQHERSA